LISHEKLTELYAAMVKCRMIAERTAALAKAGAIPRGWTMEGGDEAALAGITGDLGRGDVLSAPGNRWVSALAVGVSLEDLLARAGSSRNGHGGSGTGSGGTSVGEAMKAAKAHKAAKDGKIVLVYLNDPDLTDSAGAIVNRMQRAVAENLPVVFVSHFASRTLREEFDAAQRGPKGAPEALAFGMPRITVDAGDVLAVYRVASESIGRARGVRGPTLIECVDHALLFPEGTVHEEGLTDPMRVMQEHLGKKKIPADALRKVQARVRRKVHAAFGALERKRTADR
jgi:TPP-dependent pyruvate/acetoin dehydrogenase alpha subunit